MPSAAASAETRQRLLEAGGEVFALRGFRNATVREICGRAGANIAAVNYHFRDKEKLYAEVLKWAHGSCVAKYPPDLGLKPGATAREKLHAFVRSFLLRTLDEGRPAWHGKLMSREMAEPTGALALIAKQSIRPMWTRLTGIVREIVGSKAGEAVVRRAAASVVGQVLFYHHFRPVISLVSPETKTDAAEIEALADHITEMSIRGMKGLSR